MQLRQIKKNANRAILSEVLPYELPLPFDSHGLFQFQRKIKFEWINQKEFRVLESRLDNSGLIWLELIFDKTPLTKTKSFEKWAYFTLSIKKDKARIAHPYKYVTRRNNGKLRELTVIHPHSMLDISRFIDTYSDSILYYTNRSSFSIRHPYKVARLIQSQDKYFLANKDNSEFNLEQHNLEYDYVSSYFTYRQYNNIYRFYSSAEFRAYERKYPNLLKLDVAKCFDSIYTHTISWVTNGWNASKDKTSRNKTTDTFGGLFDAYLQAMNYGETSGIIIGPEFSRIFAEIILQEVDVALERELADEHNLVHGVDYEIKRYVDDYFIFLANIGHGDKIRDTLEKHLTHFKLHLNDKKTETLHTPLQSHLSIAKYRVLKNLNELTICDITLEDDIKGTLYFSSDKALIEYKSALLDSSLDHGELANFYLYSLEQVTKKATKKYLKYIQKIETPGFESKSRLAKSNLAKYLMSVIDVAFFVYAGAPSASHSIKLARIIVSAIDTLKTARISYIELTSFTGKIEVELKSQLIAVRDEKDFGLHTLNIIDCLTYLGVGMNSDEIEAVLKRRGVSMQQLDTLSVLTLMRHCGSRAEAVTFHEKLAIRAQNIIQLGLVDPKYETERAILQLSIFGNTGLTNNDLQKITKFSAGTVNLLRDSNLNLLFDWSINDSYHERLLLKSARAVY